MTTTIIVALLALLFIIFALALLSLCQRLLSLVRPAVNHHIVATLARRIVYHLIAELHNGANFEPPTLEHAIDLTSKRLTDLLLLNNYPIRDWNPRVIATAVIGEPDKLHHLQRIINARKNGEPCPGSTFTPPTTHTPPSSSEAQ